MAPSALSGVRAASLFSLLASASALPGLAPRQDGGFSYKGCYVDNVGGQRALGASTYADDQMTVESCASFCKQHRFFGVEYGRECWCGDAEPSTRADQAECSFACPGDASKTCGAGDRLDVYGNAAVAPPSRQPAKVANKQYLGCFQDSPERVLPSNIMASDDMTAEKCAANCSGFDYFGTQYGRECYCGTNAPTVSVSESECSVPCAGSDTELCGGGMLLNVWGPISTATTSPTTSGTQAPAPTVSGFSYQGCYAEVTGRALTGTQTFDAEMTVEKCASICASYDLFGVEYGSQCFCGTQLSPESTQQPETECAMPCGGNGSQLCGDANRLGVFAKPGAQQAAAAPTNVPRLDGYQYKSCWTDDVNNRALTGPTFRADDMTVQSCSAFCAGHDYFGIEYARECYCGDLPAAGQAAPASDCSQLCAGDSTQWCGNGNRLSLYSTIDEALCNMDVFASELGVSAETCYSVLGLSHPVVTSTVYMTFSVSTQLPDATTTTQASPITTSAPTVTVTSITSTTTVTSTTTLDWRQGPPGIAPLKKRDVGGIASNATSTSPSTGKPVVYMMKQGELTVAEGRRARRAQPSPLLPEGMTVTPSETAAANSPSDASRLATECKQCRTNFPAATTTTTSYTTVSTTLTVATLSGQVVTVTQAPATTVTETPTVVVSAAATETATSTTTLLPAACTAPTTYDYLSWSRSTRIDLWSGVADAAGCCAACMSGAAPNCEVWQYVFDWSSQQSFCEILTAIPDTWYGDANGVTGTVTAECPLGDGSGTRRPPEMGGPRTDLKNSGIGPCFPKVSQ